jgi:pimeloyl-ACP methyl ester carboxylesterase
MTRKPETAYARSGDLHVVYQIIGDRGPDLLFIPTAAYPIDLLWDEPSVAAYLRRLASFSPLIVTDLLGVGSSDAMPTTDLPAMHSWTDGLIAVLNAAHSRSASVFATAESALPAMLMAANHPARIRSLILWSAFARSAGHVIIRTVCPSPLSANTSRPLPRLLGPAPTQIC